jgi:large subunit ribosomal protein L23e
MAKNAKGKAKPACVKLKITRAIPVGAQIPCVDNSGAKLLNVISVYFTGSRLNRLPSATLGDMMLVSVRQGKPELKKKGKN